VVFLTTLLLGVHHDQAQNFDVECNSLFRPLGDAENVACGYLRNEYESALRSRNIQASLQSDLRRDDEHEGPSFTAHTSKV
jgi:hypothetical protein